MRVYKQRWEDDGKNRAGPMGEKLKGNRVGRVHVKLMDESPALILLSSQGPLLGNVGGAFRGGGGNKGRGGRSSITDPFLCE